MTTWPEARIDNVTRLRALAAAQPHVCLLERDFDVPFDAFWGLVGDLDHGTPQFEAGVRSIEILERDGERLRARAQMPLRTWADFDVLLRPGFCLMQSRFGGIGMAAVPLPDGATRFAHYEGSRWLGRLGIPLFRRSIHDDFRRLGRIFEGSATRSC